MGRVEWCLEPVRSRWLGHDCSEGFMLISASRGCRYVCEFCTLWKLEAGTYRARPAEEVWQEMASPVRPVRCSRR